MGWIFVVVGSKYLGSLVRMSGGEDFIGGGSLLSRFRRAISVDFFLLAISRGFGFLIGRIGEGISISNISFGL